MIIAPPLGDYGFYNTYINKVKETNLLQALHDNLDAVKQVYDHLSEEQLNYAYSADKWTLKDILLHIVDAERNFCYRALRISRGDQVPVPGYDIHAFVKNAKTGEREYSKIMNEFIACRRATIAMYEGMPETALDLTGPARDTIISVRALGYALLGHVKHHLQVIMDRYLNTVTGIE